MVSPLTELRIAWRNDPGPLSWLVATVKVLGTVRASSSTSLGMALGRRFGLGVEWTRDSHELRQRRHQAESMLQVLELLA
jgi:hypothetical protein